MEEEMKPSVAHKDDFECREKSNKNNSIFWTFATVENLLRKKINDLSSQPFATSFKLPAETKTADTKPLVTEN